MAISGFRTATGNNRFFILRLSPFLLSILVVLMTAGCSIKFGRVPPTDKLDNSLTPLLSTKADVLETVGPPRGYGMARLPARSHKPWTIWFYEYTKASGVTGKIELKMLLVFFEEEKYVSYLWFSSLEELK